MLDAWRRQISSCSTPAPLMLGLDDSPTETLEVPEIFNNKIIVT